GRAGLLLAVALFAAGFADRWWPGALAAGWLASMVLVAVVLAGFVMLSSELDRHWLTPLRHLKVRLTHPLGDTVSSDVPLLATLQRLQVSDAYRQVGATLTSDVRDSWDEGQWRILEYAARRDGKPVTAVFAVPLYDDDPGAVRVALVGDAEPAAV
ncbi:MAG: hypothetical protein ACRDT4_19465, partial [Micromonosporaceae bacterium]